MHAARFSILILETTSNFVVVLLVFQNGNSVMIMLYITISIGSEITLVSKQIIFLQVSSDVCSIAQFCFDLLRLVIVSPSLSLISDAKIAISGLRSAAAIVLLVSGEVLAIQFSPEATVFVFVVYT